MSLKNLKYRQRNLVHVKREIDEYFGAEGNCALVHILPHFAEPDLVSL